MATGILSASRPDIPALVSSDARSQQPGAFVNPAHMSQTTMSQGSQPGPSSVVRRTSKSSVTGKRRRGTSPDESGDSSVQPPVAGMANGTATAAPRKNRDGPKKKKANRACAHCQKAHLTCDDSRPCQRCIKRGIADNCIEGHRKKAKYLLDDEELDQLTRKQSTAGRSGSSSNSVSARTPIPTSQPFSANDPLFNVPFDPNFSFGSEAANLEYSILSAILGNPSPPDSGTAPSPPQPSSHPPLQSTDSAAQPASQKPNPPTSSDQTGASDQTAPPWSSDATYGGSSGSRADRYDAYTEQLALAPGSPPFMSGYSPTLVPVSQASEGQGRFSPTYDQRDTLPSDQGAGAAAQQAGFHAANVQSTKEILPNGGALSRAGSGNKGAETTQVIQPLSASSSTGPTPSPGGYTGEYVPSAMHVTSAYDYTEGYHFLMKHLPTRFEKNDILRIVRALAIFRPSLIALQMPMTDEDEIFVERCFQRSLLELEKLISFSGTPTVVWRRTGEICLVAPEFCMLTEWGIDELVGKRKYIYELFENQSVVEYWENFATHAFENTTKSVYSHCVLLKPCGAPIPATFCFTIKRDIFDLPSIVIGQWLPLL